MSNISEWSPTAASNNAEAPDGFKENMFPSQVNDSAREVMAAVRTWYENTEWRDWGHTATFASATTFTIATDVTAIYVANRPIRCTDATTLYGYVASSSYSAPNTTVTVTLDSGSLSASLTAVALGPSPSTQSIPIQAVRNHGRSLLDEGIGPHYVQNLGVAGSVATKALTVTLATKALAMASSTDPIQIAFRNATLTTGDYTVVSATTSPSLVVPSGATLGFAAAEDGLVYVYAINNAGTVELAVSKKALFDESIVHSTTAISATADSDNVLYSTTARTGVAVRLVGRIRITTGAVAGEWDNAATRIEPWMPGMKKTGDSIQVVEAIPYITYSNTAVVIPSDNTIPQNTEGSEIMSAAIIPKSSINRLQHEFSGFFSGSTTLDAVIAMFQDATANALAATVNTIGALDHKEAFALNHDMAAGTVSATTFKIRVGPGTAGTLYINGNSTTRLFGGIAACRYRITEIQA